MITQGYSTNDPSIFSKLSMKSVKILGLGRGLGLEVGRQAGYSDREGRQAGR
jgi:hypothetical protein